MSTRAAASSAVGISATQRCTAKHAASSAVVFEAVAHTSTKILDVLLQVFAEVLPWPRVGRASRILKWSFLWGREFQSHASAAQRHSYTTHSIRGERLEKNPLMDNSTMRPFQYQNSMLIHGAQLQNQMIKLKAKNGHFLCTIRLWKYKQAKQKV